MTMALPQQGLVPAMLLSALRPERLFPGRRKFPHYRLWQRDFLSSYVVQMPLGPRTLSRPRMERKNSLGHCTRTP